MQNNSWARLLAYVTGLVNQRLLLQCEYLIAENRILRSHVSGRLRLSDAERSTLAEIGKRLGRKCLAEVACVAKPETILAWYRRLIARKFDGSKHRSYPGRPRVGPELEALILRMAQENKGWGYDRIVGALANLFHFARALGKPTSDVLFWAVTTVRAPQEMRGVRLAIGSNAASVWWVNGQEVVAIFGDRQTVIDDGFRSALQSRREQTSCVPPLSTAAAPPTSAPACSMGTTGLSRRSRSVWSSSRERNEMSTILIITGDGGESYEALYAVHRFQEEGWDPRLRRRPDDD